MDAEFDELVDALVLEAAQTPSPRSFDDLVVTLPGVYPTEVLLSVGRLRDRGDLDAVAAARLKRRQPEAQSTGPFTGTALPVPHPLDYDWRFSTGAVERLRLECRERSAGERCVLLGAPSVFVALRDEGELPALLLDANRCVVDTLNRGGSAPLYEARLCDLSSGDLPAQISPVVVIDPPWYREHEHAFLWAAARLCEQGGSVLVSVPAVGTRPGIEDERREMLRWAEGLGFEIEGLEPGALGHVSPPFEQNALSAVGLRGLPTEWRRGDLLVLRLRERRQVRRPHCDTVPSWPEVTVGSVRIRVRPDDTQVQDILDPRLCEVVPGNVLDTVSRRDTRRGEVRVWTSGNRVFGTNSPGALFEVIEGLREGQDCVARVAGWARRALSVDEMQNVRSAAAEVSAVIEKEQAELVSMGWAA